jgi:hypothetical protein
MNDQIKQNGECRRRGIFGRGEKRILGFFFGGGGGRTEGTKILARCRRRIKIDCRAIG